MTDCACCAAAAALPPALSLPQPALSMSISHTSFQAELEGAILQQTASVDLYLQTHAPRWSPDCYDRDDADDEGCAALLSLFLSDLSCGAWQQPYAPSGSNAGMQQQPAWTLEHTRKRRPRQQALLVGGFRVVCACLKGVWLGC